MMTDRSREPFLKYSRVAIALHWWIAALLLWNLYLGWRMGSLEGLARFNLFQLHKSVGMTILLFSVLRLAWRLVRPAPPMLASMRRWEKLAAASVHWVMYGFMIAMPLTGWIIVSASPMNLPTKLFKTIPLPHLGFIHDLSMVTRKTVQSQVGELHEVMAFGFAALMVLHVLAALKHHFIARDGELYRMLPFGRPG